MLLTPANMQMLTDKYAAIYERSTASIGLLANQGAPLVPSSQNLASKAVQWVLGLNDADQVVDVLPAAGNALANMNVEQFSNFFLLAPLNAINSHCLLRGSKVSGLINSLQSYLSYYNGGGGGAPFSGLLAWSFGNLWFSLRNSWLLNVVGTTGQGAIMSPYIGPLNNAPNGMATKGVNAGFVAGANVSTTMYSEVQLCAVVTTSFAGGGGPPQVVVTGTDNTGSPVTTWTGGVPGGNNPTAALATQTITGSLLAQARATVSVGSATGIAIGSVLTINRGLPDQETVYVEAVPSSTSFTAVFQNAHAPGATVDGNTTVLLVPQIVGRRCRSINNITIGTVGHNAGAVRIDGVLDRVAV